MIRFIYYTGTFAWVGLVFSIIGRFAHLSWLVIAVLSIAFSTYLVTSMPLTAAPADGPLASQLEAIRAKNNVPALGAALFTTDGLQEMAVAGFRKRGASVRVTDNDLWHLGSDTKAMTATLAGTFVAEGKLKWDDKVASFFPAIAADIPVDMRTITVRQVLSHTAGLKDNLDWASFANKGSLMEQRRLAVRQALATPAYPRGPYHYSNTDYVVIAAVLEKISGQPWEKLMQDRLFRPLGITTAGFGGLGTPGQINQPWPHDDKGTPMPTNGPTIDNPPVMGPAGTVHMTIADWSKFLTDQLRGAAGEKALLPKAIYEAIQSPVAKTGQDASYGLGWGIVNRGWGGGKVLQHAGSNTMNYCVAWLAPNKKFGVLATCNQGGTTATKACDEAVSFLIQRYSGK